ncbi:flavoprotein, partial [Aeromonas salmonicida]
MRLADKRILLGVSGGIAAYKSAELVRRLEDQRAAGRVVCLFYTSDAGA